MNKENPELPTFDSNDENNNQSPQQQNPIDYNDEDIEFDEIYGDEDPGEDDGDDYMEDPEDICSMSGFIFNLMKMPKPLGFFAPQEKMEEFLKARGYKMIKRYSDSKEEEYTVAIKPGTSYIPEDNFSNVREVFDGEVQDILLKWLLRIGKEE